MSKQVLKDAKILLGAYDLSGMHNKLNMSASIPVLDTTCFGETTKTKAGSPIMEASWDGGGIAQTLPAGSPTRLEPHDLLHGGGVFAADDQVCTLGVDDYGVGDHAWLMSGIAAELSNQWTVADLFGFGLKFDVDGPCVYGRFLGQNDQGGVGAENGTELNWDAVSATQRLYATLHVTAHDCTQLLVKVQSSAASGFAAPVDEISFTSATGLTAELKSAAGPITNQYWRFTATTIGGNGTASFVVAIGIL